MARLKSMAFPLLAFAILAAPIAARAEQWPNGPIRIIESLPAGVARDAVTRLLANKLSTALGQQVLVENRPGAAGRTAGAAAAKAAPDGYTFIMMGTAELAIIRHLYTLSYDIDHDFEPVSMVAIVPVALVVRSSLPVQTLAEFIAHARSHPEELTYGSTGPGLFLHLNGALLSSAAGIKLRHIPYSQGSPFTDLLGGHIDMVIDALQPTYDQILAGKLKGIALTGNHRAKVLPDLPTFAEAGLPAFDVHGFYGLLAPKGTPAAIIRKMRDAVAESVKDPAVQFQAGDPVGATIIASTPEEFTDYIRRETQRWGEVIRANKIKID
jgi:tripartite-type tricarboxylate transporter receptor subunit TctC